MPSLQSVLMILVITILSTYYFPTSKLDRKSVQVGCTTQDASLIFLGSPTPRTGKLSKWVQDNQVPAAFFVDADEITNEIYKGNVVNLESAGFVMGIYLKDVSELSRVASELSEILNNRPQYVYLVSYSDSDAKEVQRQGYAVVRTGFDIKISRSFQEVSSDFTNFLAEPQPNQIISILDNEKSIIGLNELSSIVIGIRQRQIKLISLAECIPEVPAGENDFQIKSGSSFF